MGYTFTWSVPRTYPEIVVNGVVLTAEPGQTYDLSEDPGDGRWTLSGAVAGKTKVASLDTQDPVSEPAQGEIEPPEGKEN
ncbi:MAG: hypothetical protein KGH65_04940 [Candidatus Micrarchaeota archaeon]|nr:hypothetical protein [Candidatus Micrarchaeota archaeon]